MKRKLDANNEPAVAQQTSPAEPSQPAATETDTTATPGFADLGLDPRLLQAIAKLKYQSPTLVQSKVVPLALDGQDVLAKAKTGSGKTAAYLLPVLHGILKRKQTASASHTAALILVPTRELADQVLRNVEQLSAYCAKDIQAVKLTDQVTDAVQRSILSSGPDIVISTPARAWQNISNGALSVDDLTHLVLDEADLVLSYGYDEDLQNVARSIPKGLQTILMSATLTTDVSTVQGLFCRDPKALDLEEPDAEGEGVSQFYVKCGEDEKFLLAYVIFKLQLMKGKCIIFVADVDRCYRLRLYFEQFGIRAAILNSELPVNSRLHVVEQFNKNVYDIIICSDENEVLGDEDHPSEAAPKEDKTDDGGDKDEKRPKKKQRKTSKRDRLEFGVSRGIDFQHVSAVINFDFPTSSKSYTHRIGRTARAGQRGMALSFVVPKDQFRKHMPTSIDTAEHDEKVLAKVIRQQGKRNKEVKPYVFDMKQVENFRYRMNDALRAVTKSSIREARTRELRQELLKSERLKRHFEENPADLDHLRHDGELRAARTQPHLRAKHVPDYLLPKEGRKALTAAQVGFVPMKKTGDHKNRRNKFFKTKGKQAGGRKSDPLRTFKARRKTK
ncbi:P-loop containing nucleoside triphosphate hydrolase protein [Coniella lustricola]|uniref:RNA helicase n=1 Tax=Coniella lustricola TaxID=2025994 RepID=A0A2T2ZVQ8_9PEZI|nr:P-loop containing nucleoside triphosphate hydrolase protein [Coniella lustricola]